jgi:iron(III) transport system ATP-binding protein
VSSIRIEGLVKRYGHVEAVSKVSLEVRSGEVLGLLGPSGCGKTTILKCIAGLEELSEGEIFIDDQLVASRTRNLPPERRNIGMVFQSYALWPHKTVYANVSYPLEVQGEKRSTIRPRVELALKLLGLEDLVNRHPGQLSGGQQQRVAVARAIVREPKILLFDEPLSNLDASTRRRVRGDLRRLLRRVGITSIYVTHDQLEAMAVCDKVVLMHEGRIIQVGSADELYRRPAAPEVAELIGSGNFTSGHVKAIAEPGSPGKVEACGIEIECQLPNGIVVGEPVLVLLRVEDLSLSRTRVPGPNCWDMRVADQTNFGAFQEYLVSAGEAELIATSQDRGWNSGDSVFVSIRPNAVIAFRADA